MYYKSLESLKQKLKITRSPNQQKLTHLKELRKSVLERAFRGELALGEKELGKLAEAN